MSDRQDGRTDRLRLNSGSFGTFWGPYELAHPKILDLAQLLHGEKLWTDKPTNPQTNKLEALFEGIPQAAAVDLEFCPVNRTALA